MSQYSNALPDRYPLATAYYHRSAPANSADGTSVVPMPFTSTQGAPHQVQGQTWPPFYAEHHSLPQPSNFDISYASSSCPSPPASLGVPYPDVTETVPSVNHGGDVSRFAQDSQSFIGNARPVQYASSGQSLLVQDYPTSAQRTNMEPSPPPQLPSFLPLYGFKDNRDASPSSPTSVSDYESGTNWESRGPSQERLQYLPSCRDGSPSGSSAYIEAATRYPSLPASTTSNISAQTSVKIEPDDPDGCFIMEQPSFADMPDDMMGHSASARSSYKTGRSAAPPTEVPLRATQASKEMRGMMGVFRLNPFAMHSLSVGGGEGFEGQSGLGCDGKVQASWCGEAGPLEEEPVILEFQLDIEGLEVESEEISPTVTIGKEDVDLPVENLRIQAADELRLRSFSPSFELHPDDIGSDLGSQHQGRDQSTDRRTQERDYENDLENDSWRDGDYGSRSEVDTTSSTTTRSVHTPFYDSPDAQQTQVHEFYEPRHHDERPTSASAWDVVCEQYMGEENRFPLSRPTSSSGMPYVQGSMRFPKLHTTTSHPYLRKNQLNHPISHGHSQSFSHTHSHNLSYGQPQTHSDVSFPTHQTENNAHISSQYVPNHHERQLQQNHVPSYAVPVVGSTHVVDDVQNHPGSTSYMRKVNRLETWPKPELQHLPNEEQEYDPYGRVCSPSGTSSGSNEGYMYPETAASAHAAIHARAMNLASNRRWSLPETGHTAGHGVGHGGSFLSFM